MIAQPARVVRGRKTMLADAEDAPPPGEAQNALVGGVRQSGELRKEFRSRSGFRRALIAVAPGPKKPITLKFDPRRYGEHVRLKWTPEVPGDIRQAGKVPFVCHLILARYFSVYPRIEPLDDARLREPTRAAAGSDCDEAHPSVGACRDGGGCWIHGSIATRQIQRGDETVRGGGKYGLEDEHRRLVVRASDAAQYLAYEKQSHGPTSKASR